MKFCILGSSLLIATVGVATAHGHNHVRSEEKGRTDGARKLQTKKKCLAVHPTEEQKLAELASQRQQETSSTAKVVDKVFSFFDFVGCNILHICRYVDVYVRVFDPSVFISCDTIMALTGSCNAFF